MHSETDRFMAETADTFLAPFHENLRATLSSETRIHGRAEEWDAALATVQSGTRKSQFDTDTVSIGDPNADFEEVLTMFLPWRKGPFQVGKTLVDTEWRSDWKWQRINRHIEPLKGKQVLDIGCGNGYHLFRMLGAGAELALGIDPTILFNYQFSLLQRLSQPNNAYLLPLRSEHLPQFNGFDTVFSLGVLYHRRSPIDHLKELLSFAKPGGELVLETLIVEGDQNTLLIPRDRYAKMANVWFIPSTLMLELMLRRAGFIDVKTVDVNVTSLEEQRATRWMQFQSLEDYLDPTDKAKTVEGYPAPARAILTARKPV
ncbi:MAG: tRNA 5-methoxyuridine(34)/uridine 5-oxyacetic acid(34) synthase CmoB [Gammaproteobacteria bacterium]|mgnify:CR=1 FL=1|jgi:tRNA (mo5U34)-methyltransferase|nr:tRNA 5-methoxyuridine(34)/uridine 5-oxyacetic acid(34) synthase CmoB [Gammaproteobacteria bacterium]MBT5153117.1 tRNA 5-methoxyuridine(34)/uridine 5-oxyacetic acid(34) synthase CmoB [Gammaproteobacteria bacterium]MBT5684453.1 tRNA 5-methoxyuridine(34)/uridine 5-oxyacetic acid(34) synthase CmoB [Gammaproteobacteria bacterium]MBT6585051.1 tRNA 5-methoxyuridine(34)/uridine 5-oxyacetic acid(34) synthase CmoB [Gammaproteobacteria bacterium]